MLPFKSPQAQSLHHAVDEAYAALQTAPSNYEQSAAVLRELDDPLTRDGVVAVRKAGLDYAAAALRYSEAVMAWVGYVDSHLSVVKKKSLGKTDGVNNNPMLNILPEAPSG